MTNQSSKMKKDMLRHGEEEVLKKKGNKEKFTKKNSNNSDKDSIENLWK